MTTTKRIEDGDICDEAKELIGTVYYMLDNEKTFFEHCFSKWEILTKVISFLKALHFHEAIPESTMYQVLCWTMDELDERENIAHERL